nr:PREDICTED: uncharacterized protein LOC100560860 [Anolis carolinensis]|eukprot:XP_008111981.1 PREDICTED: uncharacterized protein LOC100560860 [Anolis carolinensis]
MVRKVHEAPCVAGSNSSNTGTKYTLQTQPTVQMVTKLQDSPLSFLQTPEHPPTLPKAGQRQVITGSPCASWREKNSGFKVYPTTHQFEVPNSVFLCAEIPKGMFTLLLCVLMGLLGVAGAQPGKASVTDYTQSTLHYAESRDLIFSGTSRGSEVSAENSASTFKHQSMIPDKAQSTNASTPSLLKMSRLKGEASTAQTEPEHQMDFLAKIRQKASEDTLIGKRQEAPLSSVVCCALTTGSANGGLPLGTVGYEGRTMRQVKANLQETGQAQIPKNHDLGLVIPSPESYHPSSKYSSSGDNLQKMKTPSYSKILDELIFYSSPTIESKTNTSRKNHSDENDMKILRPFLVLFLFLFVPVLLCILCYYGERKEEYNYA